MPTTHESRNAHPGNPKNAQLLKNAKVVLAKLVAASHSPRTRSGRCSRQAPLTSSASPRGRPRNGGAGAGPNPEAEAEAEDPNPEAEAADPNPEAEAADPTGAGLDANYPVGPTRPGRCWHRRPARRATARPA